MPLFSVFLLLMSDAAEREVPPPLVVQRSEATSPLFTEVGFVQIGLL